MNVTSLSETLSNSLSFSSILILSALGLAITFGVMRVINMAHGDMMMLGAYTTVWLTDPNRPTNRFLHEYLGPEYGLNIYAAIPFAFVVVGFVGYLLEVGLIRFMYGRPLDTLLATAGVGMMIRQSVNLFYGSDLQSSTLPTELRGGLEIGGLTIPYLRMFILGVTCLCLLGVYLWFYRTPFGLKIRAVVQNRAMASSLGISTRKIDSMTFAIATGLAGVAGSILAYLYTTKYTMGNDYIVEAFMVVTLGGMGQIGGSVGGGALYGTTFSIAEKGLSIWVKWLPSAPMARVIILLSVVAFLLIRPTGIFATKERSYE